MAETASGEAASSDLVRQGCGENRDVVYREPLSARRAAILI